MNEIEILRAAKEHLFENGWQKGGMGPSEGPNCLAGAMGHSSRTAFDHVVFTALADNIESEHWKGRGFYKVQWFNDQESTTFDDIVDLIDQTIKDLEQ